MAEQELRVLRVDTLNDMEDADEAQEVLAALQDLRRRVTIPVIQACLDEVCEDIAHLTSTGEQAAAEDRTADVA